MLSRYKEALTDPERLALDNEIALVDTRIMDILGRVDTGEAGRHWAQVGEAYTSLINSMRENDTAGVSAALEKMNREIGMGVSDYAAWKEIIDLITSRRRLVESERKRLMQMKALVAIDEAINWVRAFIETVRGHVDQETMVRIQGDFAKLAAKTGDYASPEIDEIIEGEVVVEEKE